MDKKQQALDTIIKQGVLPLYFYPDFEVSKQVLLALYNAGIKAVEYTNRGEAALTNFIELKKIADKELPGLQLGIGTIKNKQDAIAFMNAGADFIVCPGMIEEVAETTHNNGLLWIPGCITATEIIKAEAAGAQLVKLFPGSLLGPSYVTAIKELFPGLYFMPTGGVEVSEANMGAWFKAGVVAVGLGSKVISKELMEAKEYDAIEKNVIQALQIVKTIQSTR